MTDSPPALTLQRPWGWAIMWAGKDVENRTWPTRYRGPLFIHQGKGMDKAALQFAPLRHMIGEIGDHHVDEQAVIFGWVQLVGCHEQTAGCCESPWGLPDQWHWVLREPRPLEATVMVPRGALGLWRPDEKTVSSIRACTPRLTVPSPDRSQP